jgi:flavin reductase (DIM6/NTAB) family NADH-FMN oxidoreductase RutF
LSQRQEARHGPYDWLAESGEARKTTGTKDEVPAMKTYDKQDFPVGEIRRFLEPGPIVLVSSAWQGEKNIMTMGWHMVMAFSPSLIGCYIWSANHSFDMVRGSKACVINIPTVDLAPKVVGIGNSSGRDIDKFAKFQLTAVPGTKVKAPLIAECYANYECKLVDSSLIRKYSLFVLEVVKAHVAISPKYPRRSTTGATACS